MPLAVSLPNAKIATIYQNRDIGKARLAGLKRVGDFLSVVWLRWLRDRYERQSKGRRGTNFQPNDRRNFDDSDFPVRN
ncbi:MULTISPECIES: hypothetical protein [unclassified Bradyrhizobium]|uniref:hypothetical protein n=1 Tax=unclassified Bradyrhizobium TaxID=2631580 RepID=UPI002478B442|nr:MULTISPECIES: hypothetical protein [unclassified Bradyrhizobium]WGS19479.1 hypothetical protein MTX22_34710 [Bradyrhizobium sp. ISRA463]WGS26317.1 hypothetical protein MTX19_32200 [Bradyrhizobium sp. ISRA464]